MITFYILVTLVFRSLLLDIFFKKTSELDYFLTSYKIISLGKATARYIPDFDTLKLLIGGNAQDKEVVRCGLITMGYFQS